ncbi:MAG: STAS domain-containing protein [Clostridia bacterium]|nr:STAS domain-containing protein [Clostridia bacterium]MCD8308665.1 STAS domain-containing protein [Clostridia bacterium]
MQNVKLISAEEKLVIALYGEIDSSSSEDFYAQVNAIYSHDKKDIEFDCTALTFIDSTALGTFVKIFKHVKESGYKLSLKNVQKNVKRVFHVCALDTIMEID